MAIDHRNTHTLPDWIRVAQIDNPHSYDYGLAIVLQGYDGDAVLFHKADGMAEVRSPGRSDRCTLTKRQILEHVIETATKQLAILALEEK